MSLFGNYFALAGRYALVWFYGTACMTIGS